MQSDQVAEDYDTHLPISCSREGEMIGVTPPSNMFTIFGPGTLAQYSTISASVIAPVISVRYRSVNSEVEILYM